MVTSIQSPSKISLAEFLLLPETKPTSEYVDGQIYQNELHLNLGNIASNCILR